MANKYREEAHQNMDMYQEFTGESAMYSQEERQAINYCVLGMAGEAGEVADKWKKIIRDKGGTISAEDKIEIMYEVGDVLWYVARLSKHLGFDLSEVARYNEFKLQSRMARDKISGSGDTR